MIETCFHETHAARPETVWKIWPFTDYCNRFIECLQLKHVFNCPQIGTRTWNSNPSRVVFFLKKYFILHALFLLLIINELMEKQQNRLFLLSSIFKAIDFLKKYAYCITYNISRRFLRFVMISCFFLIIFFFLISFPSFLSYFRPMDPFEWYSVRFCETKPHGRKWAIFQNKSAFLRRHTN